MKKRGCKTIVYESETKVETRCSDDDDTLHYAPAVVAGAFVGSLIGSIFGPVGTAIGALYGGGLAVSECEKTDKKSR